MSPGFILPCRGNHLIPCRGIDSETDITKQAVFHSVAEHDIPHERIISQVGDLEEAVVGVDFEVLLVEGIRVDLFYICDEGLVEVELGYMGDAAGGADRAVGKSCGAEMDHH